MLKRLLLIVLAFLAACVAGALLLVGLLAVVSPPSDSAGLGGIVLKLLFWSGIVAVFIGLWAAFPAAVIISIAEWLTIRSLGFYAIGGAVVAMLLDVVVFKGAHGVPPDELILVGCAGLGAGVVYWWIAGRRAGRRAA